MGDATKNSGQEELVMLTPAIPAPRLPRARNGVAEASLHFSGYLRGSEQELHRFFVHAVSRAVVRGAETAGLRMTNAGGSPLEWV